MTEAEQILVIKRRGVGTSDDPWTWTGRSVVRSVHDDYVSHVGEVEIEREIHALAKDRIEQERARGARIREELRVRILVPGSRGEKPAPVLRGSLGTNPKLGPKIFVNLRGAVRSLSNQLGRLVPLRGLVTIQAWVGDETSTTIEIVQQQERDLARVFHAFLVTKLRREVFGLREVLPGERLDQRLQHRLTHIAADYAARGFIEAETEGKRRVYIVRRVPEPLE